jgi:transcriptional antiterminator RfaH
MTAESAEHWYLVYCKPRQEATARRHLERQGYRAYLPLVRESRRRSGRRVALVVPMFPRYLFIRLSTQTDNWGPIRSTVGVMSLVRFGQMPTPVPDGLVELLRQREDADGIQALPAAEHQPGAKVRIMEGRFAGYEGIFVARSGRDRVAVLLQVLGRGTRTIVDINAIDPAE